MRAFLASTLLLMILAAEAGRPPTLLVLGDSISAGYGVTDDEGWVELLHARLEVHGFPHDVANISLSGEKTWRGQVRLPTALERYDPVIVVIQLGINDVMQGLPEGIEEPPLEVIRTRLTDMVNRAQASGARVMLLGVRLPARYGPNYGRRFEDVYRGVADTTGATLVPRVLARAEDTDLDDRHHRLLEGDSIHPTPRGHALLLDNIWPTLLPLLRQTFSAPVLGRPIKIA
ncbi:MAG: arylesterase [Halofilum sp. (in: g-proteobacteria)]